VEFFCSLELEEYLKELLWSYQQCYIPGVQDRATDVEQKRYEEESNSTWSAFKAAFEHLPEFSQAFLAYEDEEASKATLLSLIEWAKEIVWPGGSKDGFWESAADNPKDCRSKTNLFMKNQIWPLTKTARYDYSSIRDAEFRTTEFILILRFWQ
jgi:hypothetical protein